MSVSAQQMRDGQVSAAPKRIRDLEFTDLYLDDRRYSLKVYGRLAPLPEMFHAEAAEIYRGAVTISQTASGGDGFSFTFDGVRYRASAIRHMRGLQIVLRRVANHSREWDSLGYPGQILPALLYGSGRLVQPSRRVARGGLIIVAGETDSGKSTTSVSLVREILRREAWSAMTIEDPVETLHDEDFGTGAVCIQREVHRDEFHQALREALRANMDLVMVGEIRDTDAAMTAINGAMTGHLVITTLHAANIPSALARIVELLPMGAREINFATLARAFRACIWQSLNGGAAMSGRFLFVRALFATQSVRAKLAKGMFDQLQHDIDLQWGRIQKDISPIEG